MPFLLVLYLIVVLAIFALAQGVVALREDKRRRPAAPPGDSLRRKSLGDDLPWLAPLSKPIERFETLVGTSGVKTSAAGVLGIMAGMAVAGVGAAYLGKMPLQIVLAAPVAAGVLLPVLFLMVLRRKRLSAFTSQLPEALGMLVRSLRVGHPVSTGLKTISTEMPDPIATEFRLVHESMAFGLNLKQALEKMSQRLKIPEVHYMVAAIRIHATTGGNLADVLASLAAVMKQREILRLKVKALSAQSRLSGNILSIVPFAIVGMIYRINPDYYEEVYRHPVLAYIMGAAGVITVVGVIAIRRIVNFRV